MRLLLRCRPKLGMISFALNSKQDSQAFGTFLFRLQKLRRDTSRYPNPHRNCAFLYHLQPSNPQNTKPPKCSPHSQRCTRGNSRRRCSTSRWCCRRRSCCGRDSRSRPTRHHPSSWCCPAAWSRPFKEATCCFCGIADWTRGSARLSCIMCEARIFRLCIV